MVAKRLRSLSGEGRCEADKSGSSICFNIVWSRCEGVPTNINLGSLAKSIQGKISESIFEGF